MKPPRIIIPWDVVDTLMCVYKIHYAGAYIVVMAKSVYRSIDSINYDMKRFHAGTREGSDEKNLYKKFYHHILENPNQKFKIEMVLSSDKPYQLLKRCQIELDAGFFDGKCLNTFYSPYIRNDLQKPPNKRRMGWEKHWWINRGAYLNFCNWRMKNPRIINQSDTR